MRSLALALLLVALTPLAAQARNHPVVPPSNSGADQYVEIIPTAGGGRPTHGIHAPGHAGGGHGPSAPSGGARSGSGSAVPSSAVPGSAGHAMAGQGRLGAAALAFAQATAPPTRARGGATTNPIAHAAGAAGQAAAPASTAVDERPASASVLDSLSGGSAGGLGVALPILLGVILVAAVAVRWRRRRGVAE